MYKHKYISDIKISIANCAGRSNIGQMSLEISKRIDKALPYANINCLPAIYPKLKPANKFFEADAVVVIDGCKEACVLKTIVQAGIKPSLRIAPDETFHIEKIPGLDYDEKIMIKIADKVIKMVEDLYKKLKKEKIKKLKGGNYGFKEKTC